MNERYKLNLYNKTLQYFFENCDFADHIEVRFFHILLKMIMNDELEKAERELDRKIYEDSIN